MNRNPKVSVVSVTTYPTSYIMFQLPSILLQREVDFEYVIVDTTQYKETTEEIEKVYSDNRIQFADFSKSVCNPSSMKNAGVDSALGDYILILDDNVTITPYFLRRCVDSIKPGSYLGIDLDRDLNEDPEYTFNNYAVTFLSKGDFIEYGGFDESLVDRFQSAFTYQHKLRSSPLTRIDIPFGAVRIPDASDLSHIRDNCQYVYGDKEFYEVNEYIKVTYEETEVDSNNTY